MDQQNQMCRRDLFKAGAVGALLAGLGGAQVLAAPKKKKSDIGIALQLYSVRGDCAKDFDKALDQVAKMGFDAVEFAGYHSYANDAEGLRKRLDSLGLKVAATHIGTKTLTGNTLAKTIDFHQTIGCKYLCVPGDGRFWDPTGSIELAAIFNEADKKLRPLGMACGYHNHKNEFKKEGNKTYWDLFAERTSDNVVLQQDVGWTVAAGLNPASYVWKYPGRSQVIHCKPTVVGEGIPILGQDSVPWTHVFEACEAVGGTEWYTIEQERYLPDTSPMDCSRLSLAGMKAILNFA
jgi:sugar phosphate isomerase/epimerase